MTLRAAALLFIAVAAQAQEPVRIVILSRLTQSLPEALQLFEARHGAGRIALSYGDAAAPPADLDRAHVVLAYNLHSEEARSLAPRIRPLLARRATVLAHWPEGALRHWNLTPDPARLNQAIAYWNYGGPENMARLLAFLHGGLPVLPPLETLTTGIYHPRAQAPFASLPAYLAWLKNPSAPKIGILFYHTNLKNRDTAHIDALIAEIERRGFTPVAVFGWPPTLCEPLLTNADGPAVDALFALNLGFAKPDDIAFLARLNVHVIGLMTTRQSRAEWLASPHGVRTDQLALQLAAPERAGATDPITFAATERSPDGKSTRTLPIPERIERAVARAARWIHLRRAPDAEKRIALLYYNAPPGKGNIAASYLNVPGSLAALLRHLSLSGYLAGPHLPTEPELLKLLQQSGRNIEQWDPGELDAMVASGRLTLISIPQYRRWAASLPPAFLDQVNRAWGPPEKSTLMTIRTRDGKPFIVLPGLRFGNIFIGPQPLRSTFEKSAQTQHDTSLPPPHSYLAAYLWLRHHFKADAVTHVGRHGTLEFLPGKNTGQAGHDAAEAILADLPNPYFYILDGGGESMTARRRSAATIVSHLTPILAPGGPQAELRPLRDALANYAKTRATSPALAAQYQATALSELRQLHLDSQLNLARLPFDEAAARLEAWLDETETTSIPLGVHTLGQLPREEIIPTDADPTWLANLRASPARELDQFTRVLAGQYLESGPAGDPLRQPASLPSGRNLHDFDPSLIPTREACALGQKLAEDLLARIRRQTGRPATKVSLVLWYGESIRHHGALECQALHLMGVEPLWNARGVVDDLRLIPDSQLNRPRVDVVATIAGIYRDGLPDKALLLDRAARLAQSAGDNPLARNTAAATAELIRQGLPDAQARRAASARVFGPAPGDYGGGVAALVKQSKSGAAQAYLHHNNHAYSSDAWGESNPNALATHLQGNQAIVHSRSTNLYGVLDNDDFFDFAGGLSAASKSVNNGRAPDLLIANLRRPGRERLDEFRSFLAAELQSRAWNPKWLREMQLAGYSGAREMADHLENVYGWQATAPDQIDPAVWQKSYEVYIEDRHNLGLKKFFDQSNPHARQLLLARLLEVDRSGAHRFTESERARLVREYNEAVRQNGLACSANTCGNRPLQSSVTQPTTKSTKPATKQKRPFRLFTLPANFLDSPPEAAIQIGAALFVLFSSASLALGALQSLLLRRFRHPPITLNSAPPANVFLAPQTRSVSERSLPEA